MTPELGKTDTVAQFMDNPAPHQKLIGPVSWDECPHLTLRSESRRFHRTRRMRGNAQSRHPAVRDRKDIRPDESLLVIDPFNPMKSRG